MNTTNPNNHFTEVCTVETPSSLLGYSMGKSCCCSGSSAKNRLSALFTNDDNNKKRQRQNDSLDSFRQFYDNRVASEYHSIHIITTATSSTKDLPHHHDDDFPSSLFSTAAGQGLQMEIHRIGDVNIKNSTTSTGTGTDRGISSKSKKREAHPLPVPDKDKDNQFCIAHSYLPLSPSGGEKDDPFYYYLEAFVMVPTPQTMTMDLESGATGVGTTTTAAAATTDMIDHQTQTSSSSSILQSQSVINHAAISDPSRTDATIMMGSSSTAATAAATTTSSSSSKLQGVMASQHQPFVDQEVKHNNNNDKNKNNMERLQQHTTSSDRECHRIVLQGYLPVDMILDRQDDRIYGKEKRHERRRISQSIPISFCPSAIELCHTAVPSYNSTGHTTTTSLHQNDNDDHDSNIAGQFVVFLVNGNEVKVYTLQSSVKFSTTPSDINNAHMEDWLFHLVPASIVQSNSKFCSSCDKDDVNGDSTHQSSQLDMFFLPFSMSQSQNLEPLESLLTLPSAITAIHTFVYWNSDNIEDSLLGLAMGGFDGTVRIVTFHFVSINVNHDNPSATSDDKLQVANTSQYIVDGPIASLSFQSFTTTSPSILLNERMILYAGSICGFACSFSQSLEDPTRFERPILIVDGLWNPKLDDDDAVLTVCEFQYGGVESSNNVIAIGTYSGRILLFAPAWGQGNVCNTLYDAIPDKEQKSNVEKQQQQQQQQQELFCFWHCTLPYPIHSIHVHSPNHLLPELIVFTRRSVHLFQCNVDTIADLTLERIDRMLCNFKNHDMENNLPMMSTS